MRHLHTFLVTIGALLGGVLVGGCMGGPDHSAFHSDLVEVDASTEPLEPLAADEWEEAPAGCEGRLAVSDLTFRLASGGDGLVAAVDSHGEIVCVDTVESVQEELEEQGEEERADDLGDQYQLAALLASSPHTLAAADPSPQPNSQPSGVPGEISEGGNRSGDPTPVPNMEGR